MKTAGFCSSKGLLLSGKSVRPWCQLDKRLLRSVGVALAAKTLGSLMRFKRDELEWLYVKESELWNVWGGENGILPALRLSYLNLQPHLKRCFMYCSIFPKIM